MHVNLKISPKLQITNQSRFRAYIPFLNIQYLMSNLFPYNFICKLKIGLTHNQNITMNRARYVNKINIRRLQFIRKIIELSCSKSNPDFLIMFNFIKSIDDNSSIVVHNDFGLVMQDK